MQVQCIYFDPNLNHQRELIFETPIAIGSDPSRMPERLDQQQVSQWVLNFPEVADYHLLINAVNQTLQGIAQNAPNGIIINGVQQLAKTCILVEGDRLQVGEIEIQVFTSVVPNRQLQASTPTPQVCNRLIGFLFPRRCTRVSPVGCPHCDEGRLSDNSYESYSERTWYQETSSDVRDTGTIDFTEADAAALETTDIDFEEDLGAS